MKRPLFSTAALILATSTWWSAPSRACTLEPTTDMPAVTFLGARVPLNAELWIVGVGDYVSDDDVVTLVDGYGTTVLEAHIERFERAVGIDGVAGIDGLVVVDGDLTPGGWRLVVEHPAGEGYEGSVEEHGFTVVDEVDDAPPAAPDVIVETVSGGGPLEAIFLPCSSAERRTWREVTITLNEPEDIARVVVDGVTHTPFEGQVVVGKLREDGGDVVVSVYDFAGNESEVVSSSSGGCASTPASTSLFAALVLVVRRRRRTA